VFNFCFTFVGRIEFLLLYEPVEPVTLPLAVVSHLTGLSNQLFQILIFALFSLILGEPKKQEIYIQTFVKTIVKLQTKNLKDQKCP